MQAITEIQYESDLKDFKEVIKKIRTCDIIVNYDKLLRTPSGELKPVGESEIMVESSECIVDLNRDKGFAYVTIKSDDKENLLRLKNYWDRYKARMTHAFVEMTPVDHQIRITAGYYDKSKSVAYVLVSLNPIFASFVPGGEKMCLELLVDANDIAFETGYVDRDEMDYNNLLEAESEREYISERTADTYTTDEGDTGDDFNNEDISDVVDLPPGVF